MPRRRRVGALELRQVHDAGGDAPALGHRQRQRPGPAAGDEGAGAVDRVDDEDALGGEPLRPVLAFLRQPAVAGAGGGELGPEHAVDREVGLRHGAVAARLLAHLGAAEIAQRHRARRPRRRLEQRAGQLPAMTSPSTSRLGTTRLRWGRASFAGRIVRSIARRLPAMVHSLTGRHDRAVLDPEAAGAAGVVAGRRVDRGADQRGHDQPGAHLGDRARRGSAPPWVSARLPAGGARRRRGAAAGVAGALQAELAGGGEVEGPAHEHAVGDQRPARHRQPLGVEGARAGDAGARGILDQVEAGRQHRLARARPSASSRRGRWRCR